MRSLLVIASMFLSACATAPAEEIFAKPPPSFSQLKAEIDAKLTCASEHEVRPLPPSPDRPVMVSRCAGYFPSILQKAEIEGACISMFDIDAKGMPALVATRCNVARRQGVQPPEAWLTLAGQVLEYSATVATSRHRFRPLADAGAEMRESLAQPMRFQFEGEPDFIERPAPFQRPPPAPQLPAERLADRNGIPSQTQP